MPSMRCTSRQLRQAWTTAVVATLFAAGSLGAQGTSAGVVLAGKAPATGAATAQPPKPVKPVTAPVAQPSQATRVMIDINHATTAELRNIPGIGEVYAKKIISGRPYANKAQLVSRKIIDANLYDTIQGMIIAKQ